MTKRSIIKMPFFAVTLTVLLFFGFPKNNVCHGAMTRESISSPSIHASTEATVAKNGKSDSSFPFVDYHGKQQFLLRIRAIPADLSKKDLDFIASSFHQAYLGRQQAECGNTVAHRGETATNDLNIESVEVVTNIVKSAGSEPRTIQTLIDFSLILQADYACYNCQQQHQEGRPAASFFVLFQQEQQKQRNTKQSSNRDLRDTIANVRSSSRTIEGVRDDPYSRNRPAVPQDHDMETPSCVPTLSSVVSDFQSAVLLSDEIPALDTIYSINPILHGSGDYCMGNEEDLVPTLFTSHLTIGVNGFRDIDDNDKMNDQMTMLENALVETFNELNAMNPNVCDPQSNIVTRASVEIYSVPSSPDNWFFISAQLEGSCIGDGCAVENKCLMFDKSGLATCKESFSETSNSNHRSLATTSLLSSTSSPSCFCTAQDQLRADNLPSNQDMLIELNQRLKVLRDETDFLLVDSVGLLIESEQQRFNCCGGTAGTQVTGNLQGAISDYIAAGGASVHGTPINCWDVSTVSSFKSVFSDQNTFNEPLNCWDTSSAENARFMFRRATAFNQDIGNWNVSSVTDMSYMFYRASAFNQNISNWDVASVTNMEGMFYEALNHNNDISRWDVSNVEFFGLMFEGATSFNQPLNDWDTSSATEMWEMFYEATAFNQRLNKWDVSKVVDMYAMFYEATSFNQDISQWKIASLEYPHEMFVGTSSFNQNLCPWTYLDGNIIFDAKLITSMVFDGTSCPFDDEPMAGVGPWCYNCTNECCGDIVGYKVTDEYNFEDVVAEYFDQGEWSIHGSNINCWDVSELLNFDNGFFNQTLFNKPLNCWDTSSATSMAGLFHGASSFNQDLNHFDVSRVESYSAMFADASSFNGDVTNWETTSATNMEYMFSGASSFDQYISSWDVSSLELIGSMFNGATSFDQDLCPWRKIDDNIDFESATNVFTDTSCSVTDNPISSDGPWCKECFCDHTLVMEIMTDSSPENTGIEIWDLQGNREAGPTVLEWNKTDFIEPNTLYTGMQYCLRTKGCYKLKLVDLSGGENNDSFQIGEGYFKVSWINGTLIVKTPGLMNNQFEYSLGGGC